MTQLQLAVALKDLGAKLENFRIWKDGNGARGAESRLQDLESRSNNSHCPTAQSFKAHLEEHKAEKENNVDVIRWEKQMKQTRLTNIIGFLGLGVMIFVAMMWGG